MNKMVTDEVPDTFQLRCAKIRFKKLQRWIKIQINLFSVSLFGCEEKLCQKYIISGQMCHLSSLSNFLSLLNRIPDSVYFMRAKKERSSGNNNNVLFATQLD